MDPKKDWTMRLPDHVIENILGHDDLSFDDIYNFRLYRKEFNSNFEPWERIFFQRWPSAKKLYDQKESEGKEQTNEKLNFIETGINYASELQSYFPEILNISNNNIFYDVTLDNINQFEWILRHISSVFTEIMEPGNIKYNFFIDELKYRITQSLGKTNCDLTERYFNIKLYNYLRRWRVNMKWDTFTRQGGVQLMERAATFLAQILQPEKDGVYLHVTEALNSIAQEVLNCLQEKHPNHLIFSLPAEKFSYWRNNYVNYNHFNGVETMQIIDTLKEYFFGNFRPCNLEDINLDYMCIDSVLKNKYGNNVIVIIIYHSVARRLGLHISLPNYDYSHILKTLNFLKDYYWMNSLKFNNPLLRWHSANHALILQKSFIKREQPSTRPQDVKFAVGMIIAHDNCTGVIVGWHRCDDVNGNRVNFTNNVWNFCVDLCKIPVKHCFCSSRVPQQIYYVILTENNTMCYVGQDNLTLVNPKWIDNNEIGRFFRKFKGTHYVPNETLTRLYPHDVAVTAQI